MPIDDDSLADLPTDLPDDDSLADDGAADPDDFIEHDPGTVDAEDYDFAAMVAGVRPNRARVVIRPRSDLWATLQELAEEVKAAGDDVPEDLAAEVNAVYDEYAKTFVVVLQGWNSDRQREFHREMKRHGVDPQRKGLSDSERAKQAVRLAYAQVAAQIVHPTRGVTADAVEALERANPAEAEKLVRALGQVNNSASGDAAFLLPPSLRSRSGSA